MPLWTGVAPATPTGYNISQWVTLTPADAFGVDWTTGPNCGLTFEPVGCTGGDVTEVECSCPAPAAPGAGCVCTPITGECELETPDYVTFKPAWFSKKYECCDDLRSGDALLDRVQSELEANSWPLLAARYWAELGSAHKTGETSGTLDPAGLPEAVDVSPGGPVCAEETIGVLNAARGRLGAGVYVASGYAVPRLLSSGVAELTEAGRLTIGGKPLVADDAFGITGPAGAAPEAGAAFIYHVDQFPRVSLTNITTLQAGRNSHKDLGTPCQLHIARRQGIVAFNTCGVFAAQMQVVC